MEKSCSKAAENFAAVYDFDGTAVSVCSDYYKNITAAEVEQLIGDVREIYIKSVINCRIAAAVCETKKTEQ